MKVRNIHIMPDLVTAMLFVLFISSQTAFGQTKITEETSTRKILIKQASQIKINDNQAYSVKTIATKDENGLPISGYPSDINKGAAIDYGFLIDNDFYTYWTSSDKITDTIKITVDLGENFSLKRNDNGNDVWDDLVIYTRRHDPFAKCESENKVVDVKLRRAPTVFHIDISDNGTDWRPFRTDYSHTHVNFVMRGYGTEEFSRRITTTETFRYIRFTLQANNSRTMIDQEKADGTTEKLRLLTMSEFNIIRLAKEDNYTNNQIDRFRLVNDYVTDYEDYEFENTQSVLDENNRHKAESYFPGKGLEDVLKDNYCDWNKWVDGKWTGNADFLQEHNIELPDYSYITHENDALVEEGVRQPTHVIEHELYAVLGDVIALYPYYELEGIHNYLEDFIHWYDYKKGGYLKNGDGYNLLDFLINPEVAGRTKDAGFVNGIWLDPDMPKTELPDGVPAGTGLDWVNGQSEYRKYGTIATFFYPRATYTDEEKLENLNEEYVVAADFSLRFNKTYHLDNDKKKIKEPLIIYRHLFHIKDGKAQADEMTATKENNLAYINKHFRTVSARCNKDFQVRLESPIPVYSGFGNGAEVIRSKYYYKISDADYRRICSADIEVYDKNGNKIANPGFEFSEQFDGYGGRYVKDAANNLIPYYICGGGGKYYRMLACNAENAKPGTYIVRLIGKDYNNERIKTPDGSGHEVIVQEYHITFANEWSAFVGDEEELKTKYPNLRAEHFESLVGKPRAKVDFDEYSHLLTLSDNEALNYFYVEDVIDYSKKIIKCHYKWPVSWGNSQYGFEYPGQGDYSIYQIISNSAYNGYNAAIPPDKKHDSLWDRRYFETQGAQMGFYYFVNAAADPGVMARIRIEDLCQGATLHVTGWFAEGSAATEVANLAFNFVAVKNDGSRVILHTFTTGYIEKRGVWQAIAYSFIPDFAIVGLTEDDIDHYELELDNNAKNSSGADYAIDDIRVYVVRPEVTANQTKPLCSDEMPPIKLSTPYQTILQSVGDAIPSTSAEGEDVNVYYTFLDKERFYTVYDSIYDLNQDPDNKGDIAYIAAFDSAVVRYNYDGGDEVTTFGKMTFNTFGVRDVPYEENENTINKVVMFEKDTNNKEYLSFVISTGKGDKILPGREYFQALFSVDATGDDIATHDSTYVWNKFALLSDCSPVATFSLKRYGQVRIDGVAVSNVDEFFVCENQMPVIQLDVMGKDKENDDELVTVEENAYLDWYNGSLSEFEAEHKGDLSLKDALLQFRLNYPHTPSIEDETVVEKNDFTQEMKEYIIEMSNPQQVEGSDPIAPKLLLYQSSYVFPPVKFNGGNESSAKVVAIPTYRETDKYIVCGEPTEIAIPVRRQAPLLQHGIGAINYPSYLDDVPMRVGLAQLKEVSASKDNLATHDKMLNVSIRTVTTAKETSTELVEDNSDPNIYLVETNDPQYKDLHGQGGNDETEGLLAVGLLKEMVAKKEGENNNILRMVFDNAFNFKEGYYYRMSVAYKENQSGGSVDDEVMCEGRRVFTIKVVPQYVIWTGATSKPNWNNDRNWRRMSSGELYAQADANSDYMTDGVNDTKFAYAPLDFTKVVLPSTEPEPASGSGYPYLYQPSGTPQQIEIKDSYNGQNVQGTFNWYSDPKDPDNVAGNPENILDLENGAITYDVQYDMTLINNGSYGYNCRPWYMHTCKEIDFMPSARIYNQQYLTYEKAWVEAELDPNRWYALSSPLRDVVAGDMYMPTANARQETERFQPITFSTDKNNRFAPAVYQRSWNKAMAKVVEVNHSTRNVAVVTQWSNVFNDVNEKYDAGQGFSIKADVSGVKNFDDGDKVLMRLPKADASYEYYTQDGGTHGDETQIARNSAYKLAFDNSNANGFTASVEGRTDSPSQYFMVGNPFMTDLDLKKFLTANSDKLNPKCWIIGSDGSAKEAFVIAEVGDVTGTMPEPYIVAPMQGFFVEAKNEAATLSGVQFTKDMMVNVPNGDKPILKARSTQQSGFEKDGLRITALSKGNVVSRALITLSQDASKDYSDNEDVMLLIDEEMDEAPMVYSVAGGNAVMINSTSSIDGVEIGLTGMNDRNDKEIELMFDNIHLYDSYFLLDKVTGDKRPLEEGMSVKVSGNTYGRFYIVAANTRQDINSEIEQEQSISIVVAGKDLTVNTTRERLDVKVFDMLGHCVKSLSANTSTINTTLQQGAYVVVANDGVEEKSLKVIVRTR